MKRIFLIDYENVSDSGLDGFFDLTSEDAVYLFFTVNACKIGIEFVDQLRKHADCASLRFIRAATGNQALDFQLSSFLGGLIAEHPEKDCAFFIISKDRGYTCLPTFWSAMRPGVRVSILPRISEESRKRQRIPAAVTAAQPQAAAPQPAAPTAEPEPAAALPVQPERASEPEAQAVEAPAETVQPTEANTGPELVEPAAAKPEPESMDAITPEPEPEIAEAVEAAPAAEEPKAPAPKSRGGRRRKSQKPEAEKASAEAGAEGKTALSSADRTALNSAVQQVLSKAKCEPQISNAAASLVTKMYKDGTNRQELYRGIIKSFGREKGLEVYSIIKPVLV